MSQEIIIRKYRKEDRASVRQIAWDTAFMGEPAQRFFCGKETMADFLTVYFTDYEPESCFVAECNAGVAGYLIGAKDAQAMEHIFHRKILLKLLLKALISGIFIRKKNLIFFCHFLRSLLNKEFAMPDILGGYPATMHINLAGGFRNLGCGAKLIAAYLEYLGQNKVSGVYLATASAQATGFFRKAGFNLIFEAKRSYFRYILGKDTPIYIFAKKLS